MADEPIVEPVAEPAVVPVTEPVPAVAATDFFGTDGVLNEGWRGTLADDLKEDKSLLSFKTVGDLAKSFVTTKKMVGANTVSILSDTSTESEIEAFRIAGGRPTTVADYDLKMPEGFPEDVAAQIFPEGEMDKWKERFFKIGASQKGANELVQEFAKDVLVAQQAAAAAKDAAKAELVGALATEFGAAFDQKMHLGDIAMEDFTGGDAEMKERLAYMREDPNAIRMMIHFGGLLAEGKPPGFSAVPTPSDYQDQIDTLMEDPLYTKGTTKQRMKIANKIQELKKLQLPEPAIT